jgi:hypothetical protein
MQKLLPDWEAVGDEEEKEEEEAVETDRVRQVGSHRAARGMEVTWGCLM